MHADDRVGHIERLVAAIDLPMGRWERRPDGEAVLCFVNPPYLSWAQRSREELIGRTLRENYGDAAWNSARGAFEQAYAGQTVCYERLLTHRNGTPRWARVQVFPDRDEHGHVEAVYTIAFDIHDDVTARETLEAARRRLDHFTDNIPYPLTYLDRGCVVRFINKAYVEATGTKPAEILGRHIGEVRGERLWREHWPFYERALAGETATYTRLVELSQGARWMRTSYVPDRDASGSVVGIYTSTIDVHELTLARERLQRSVEEDAVTGVFSRRAIMERLESALPLARPETPVALFFVDLDGFKAVNDTLGHREGDRLLLAAAAALQSAVRAEDAVGRYGGDEFLVLARVRDDAGAEALARHLLEAVRRCSAGLPIAHRVSASIGYGLAPEDGDHAARLVQRADEAMYEAKRLGRDRVLRCAAIRSPSSGEAPAAPDQAPQASSS